MLKEFALKHPFITFLLVDAVVCNVINFGNNILRTVLACKGVNQETTVTEEETTEEEKA